MKRVLVMLVLILSVSFVAAYGFDNGGRAKFGGGLDYKFNNAGRDSVRNFDSWGRKTVKFSNNDYFSVKEFDSWGRKTVKFSNNDRWAVKEFDSWGRRSERFAGAVNRNNPYIVWRH